MFSFSKIDTSLPYGLRPVAEHLQAQQVNTFLYTYANMFKHVPIFDSSIENNFVLRLIHQMMIQMTKTID